MPSYCPEFKQNLVKKLISTPSAEKMVELAREHEVSRATAFRWIKQYGPEVTVVVKRKSSPDHFSMASKLRILLETKGLSDHELGEYLRRKRLYYAHILQWKEEVLEEVASDKESEKLPK